MVEMITSKQNAFVKSVRALSDKKVRDEKGLYTAEGVKSVADAFVSGQKVVSVIVTENGKKLLSSTAEIPCAAVETVSDDVFKSVSGEVTPQGVLAVIEKPKELPASPAGDCVFLDGVSDPANVGAIIRTAAAAGYKDVYLADTADAYSPKSVRASMGGIFRVRTHAGGREDLAKLLNVPVYAADMGGENAFSVKPEGNFCILVGNEAHGVSEFMRKRADKIIGIPMQNGMESLNAGVAAGVLMYALKIQK